MKRQLEKTKLKKLSWTRFPGEGWPLEDILSYIDLGDKSNERSGSSIYIDKIEYSWALSRPVPAYSQPQFSGGQFCGSILIFSPPITSTPASDITDDGRTLSEEGYLQCDPLTWNTVYLQTEESDTRGYGYQERFQTDTTIWQTGRADTSAPLQITEVQNGVMWPFPAAGFAAYSSSPNPPYAGVPWIHNINTDAQAIDLQIPVLNNWDSTKGACSGTKTLVDNTPKQGHGVLKINDRYEVDQTYSPTLCLMNYFKPEHAGASASIVCHWSLNIYFSD